MANLLFTLSQYSDWGLLALRIAVGAVFLVHGLSKRPMWRMQPSAEMPTGMLTIMRVLSIAEPLGGAALILGVLTQVAAVGLGIIMLGALYFQIVKWQKKFAGGWEFDLVLLAANIALMTIGAGRWSIDYWFLGL